MTHQLYLMASSKLTQLIHHRLTEVLCRKQTMVQYIDISPLFHDMSPILHDNSSIFDGAQHKAKLARGVKRGEEKQ
jgi:hypothetical protein